MLLLKRIHSYVFNYLELEDMDGSYDHVLLTSCAHGYAG